MIVNSPLSHITSHLMWSHWGDLGTIEFLRGVLGNEKHTFKPVPSVLWILVLATYNPGDSSLWEFPFDIRGTVLIYSHLYKMKRFFFKELCTSFVTRPLWVLTLTLLYYQQVVILTFKAWFTSSLKWKLQLLHGDNEMKWFWGKCITSHGRVNIQGISCLLCFSSCKIESIPWLIVEYVPAQEIFLITFISHMVITSKYLLWGLLSIFLIVYERRTEETSPLSLWLNWFYSVPWLLNPISVEGSSFYSPSPALTLQLQT